METSLQVKRSLSKSNTKTRSSRLPGFYKLDLAQRLDKLDEWHKLTRDEKWMIKKETLTPELADVMIENAIGVFGMPLGVAVNLQLNNKDYIVPMAIEESSVVAAASNAARLIRENGSMNAHTSEQIMISQIQIVDVADPQRAKKMIEGEKERLMSVANQKDFTIVRLGGGINDIEVEILETKSGPMIIANLIVNCLDAMGANIVNTMAETLGPIIAELVDGEVICQIVSNYSDRRMVKVKFELDNVDCLGRASFDGKRAAERIIKAYHFADASPHRAATHNKGVMNGIDGVLIATGNDWRAVEAGIHTYASKDGKYRPVTHYYFNDEGKFTGEIEVPLAVGIVGGITKIHPGVKTLLEMMNVETSAELAQVVAATGLIQNFAAIWTLATEGIQKGHMTLHAKNVAVFAGAIGEMAIRIADQMAHEGRVRFDRAKELLKHFIMKEKCDDPENKDSHECVDNDFDEIMTDKTNN